MSRNQMFTIGTKGTQVTATQSHAAPAAREGGLLANRGRLLASVAIVGTTLLGGYRGYVRRAYGACTGTTTVTCSSASTATVLPGTATSVTIDSTFITDGGTTAHGLAIQHNGNISITQASGSSISGVSGIQAHQSGAATVSVIVNGYVRSEGGTPIPGGSDQNATGMEIPGGLIAAGYSRDRSAVGISSWYNSSTRQVTVSGTGQVVADAGHGIYVVEFQNSSSDVDIQLDGIVDSGSGGIRLNGRYSSTTINITGSGNITADGDGIHVFSQTNTDGSSAIVGKVGNITAGAAGIRITNPAIEQSISVAGAINAVDQGILMTNGGGSTPPMITSAGSIQSSSNTAIEVRKTSAPVGDITITTATATGATRGIYVLQLGDGNVAITATGAVAGQNGAGIQIANNGSGASATTVTVDAAGSATGTTAGIALTSTSGRAATITSAGAITGGITSNSTGALTITNTGTLGDTLDAQSSSLVTLDTSAGSLRDFAVTAGTDMASGTHTNKGTIASSTGATGTAFKWGGTNVALDLTNDGTVTGRVETGAGNDAVTNNAGASMTGAIDLGAGTGAVANLGTMSSAASDTTAPVISAASGADDVNIVNDGTIIGTINLGAGNDVFTENSPNSWHTAGGINDFGAGANTIVNAAPGTIHVGATGAIAPVTTQFLATGGTLDFQHAGLLDMRNSIPGDKVVIGNAGGANGTFTSDGGTLGVDVAVDMSAADAVVVNGSVALGRGATTIQVNPFCNNWRMAGA